MKIEKVTPKNLALAIEIQNQLFPNESGKGKCGLCGEKGGKPFFDLFDVILLRG